MNLKTRQDKPSADAVAALAEHVEPKSATSHGADILKLAAHVATAIQQKAEKNTAPTDSRRAA